MHNRVRRILSSLHTTSVPAARVKLSYADKRIKKLTPEVRSGLTKIAFNTYAHRDDLAKVWSIEVIDGSEFIVAQDSGVPINNNYEIKSGENEIQILKGNQLIHTQEMDASVDTERLASTLRAKIGTYTYLPPLLFVEAMTYEIKDTQPPFISTSSIKTALDDPGASTPPPAEQPAPAAQGYQAQIEKSESLKGMAVSEVADRIAALVEHIIDSAHVAGLNKGLAAVKSGLGLDDTQLAQVKDFNASVLTTYKAKVISDIKASQGTVDQLIKQLNSSYAGAALADAMHSNESKLSGFDPSQISKLEAIETTAFRLDLYSPKILGTFIYTKLDAEISLDFMKPKKKRETRSPGQIDKEQTSDAAKTYQEGKVLFTRTRMAYAAALAKMPEEQKTLAGAVAGVISALGSIPNIQTVADQISIRFAEKPLEYTKTEVEAALTGATDYIAQVIHALNMVFSQQEKAFFGPHMNFVSGNTYKIKNNVSKIEGGKEATALSPEDLKDAGPAAAYLEKFNALLNTHSQNDPLVADFIKTTNIATKEQLNQVLTSISTIYAKQEEKVGAVLYTDKMNQMKHRGAGLIKGNTPMGRAMGVDSLYNANWQFFNVAKDIVKADYPDVMEGVTIAPDVVGEDLKEKVRASAPLQWIHTALGAGFTLMLSSVQGRVTEDIQKELTTVQDLINDALLATDLTTDEIGLIAKGIGETKDNYQALLGIAAATFDPDYFGRLAKEVRNLQVTGSPGMTLDYKVQQINSEARDGFKSIQREIVKYLDAAVKNVAYGDPQVQAVYKHIIDNRIPINAISYLMTEPAFADLNKAVIEGTRGANPKNMHNAILEIISDPKYTPVLEQYKLTPEEAVNTFFGVYLSKHLRASGEGKPIEVDEEEGRSASGKSIMSEALVTLAAYIQQQGPTVFPNLEKLSGHMFYNTGTGTKLEFYYPKGGGLADTLPEGMEDILPEDVIETFQQKSPGVFKQRSVGTPSTEITNVNRPSAITNITNRFKFATGIYSHLIETLLEKRADLKPIMDSIRSSVTALSTKVVSESSVSNNIYTLSDAILDIPDADISTGITTYADKLNHLKAKGQLDLADYEDMKREINKLVKSPQLVKEKLLQETVATLFRQDSSQHEFINRVMGVPTKGLFNQPPVQGKLYKTLLKLQKFAEDKQMPPRGYLPSLLEEFQLGSQVIQDLSPIVKLFGAYLTSGQTAIAAYTSRIKTADMELEGLQEYHRMLQQEKKLQDAILSEVITQAGPFLDYLADIAYKMDLIGKHEGRLNAHVQAAVKRMQSALKGIEGRLHMNVAERGGELKPEAIGRAEDIDREESKYTSSLDAKKQSLELTQKTWTKQVKDIEALINQLNTGTIPVPAGQDPESYKQKHLRDLTQQKTDLEHKIQMITEALSKPDFEPTAELAAVLPLPLGGKVTPQREDTETGKTKRNIYEPLGMKGLDKYPHATEPPGTEGKRAPSGLRMEQVLALISEATGANTNLLEGIGRWVTGVDTINFKLVGVGEMLKTTAQPISPALMIAVRDLMGHSIYREYYEAKMADAVPTVSDGFFKFLHTTLDDPTKKALGEYKIAPENLKPTVLDDNKVKDILSKVLSEVIKSRFGLYGDAGLAPADLSSLVKDVLFLTPEIPENGAIINQAIDQALATAYPTNVSDRVKQADKNRIISAIKSLTFKELGKQFYMYVHHGTAVADQVDVMSPEYTQKQADDASRFETKMDALFGSYLEHPELLQEKKNPFILDLTPYLMENQASDNTLTITQVEDMIKLLDTMLRSKSAALPIIVGQSMKTNLNNGKYKESHKDLATSIGAKIAPAILKKLKKEDFAATIGISDPESQELLGGFTPRLAILLTNIASRFIPLAMYLNQFQGTSKDAELTTMMGILERSDSNLYEMVQVLLKETAEVVPTIKMERPRHKPQVKGKGAQPPLPPPATQAAAQARIKFAAELEAELPDATNYNFQDMKNAKQYFGDMGQALIGLVDRMVAETSQIQATAEKYFDVISKINNSTPQQ